MKRFLAYGLLIALLVSCSTKELDSQKPVQDDVTFYASFEQPNEERTRVYANEDLLLRWNADDRVSIFNKNTYNHEYRFIGETGGNSGGFNKVDGAEFVTGNSISHIVSVYPYQGSTKISETENITVILPAKQYFAENTFGLGANTMVSVSADNFLQYRNVGGYIVLKLYGEGASISTIILRGNNNERIAGSAIVTMPVNGTPSVVMSNDATTEITLNCPTPVALGSSAENSTEFWFVLPPLTFNKGFTIIVKRKDGNAFTKTTTNPITISRNNLSKMSPFEVVFDGAIPNNIIQYTSTDGQIITPYKTNGFGATLISNNYVNGVGILTFNKEVTQVSGSFMNCTSLSSITLPDSVTIIGDNAFDGCTNLSTITLPDRVTKIGGQAFYNCSSLENISFSDCITNIGDYAFMGCSNLSSVVLPDSITTLGEEIFAHCVNLKDISLPQLITSIGPYFFYCCTSLKSISIPDSVESIGRNAFDRCIKLETAILPESLTSIGSYAFSGCTSLSSIIIPDSVTTIGWYAFSSCSSLTSVTIPKSLESLGNYSFQYCTSLSRIDVKPTTPPVGGEKMFYNTGLCPIYIPKGSEELYLNATYWKAYALRMMVEGSSEPIVYSSSDYSMDGEVISLQEATEGRGVNIIFMGDGYLDKDMGEGGKYEMIMREAMERFFAYEPYYTFRNRFNIYAVKVVSENEYYSNENSNRALSYEQGDRIYFRTTECKAYAKKVPNPYNQPLKIAVLFNSSTTIARSFCTMDLGTGDAVSFILGTDERHINHELGGHGFAFLSDEYVEKNETFSEQADLDNLYSQYGYGANVDWRNNPEDVRWAHFLKDSRYGYERLGIYEGGRLFAYGVYRPSENSMMRYNDTPFNAPSREQIYKCIMRFSEGNDWAYDFETFAEVDQRGRMEAAEELGPWKSPRRRTGSSIWQESHCPPIFVDEMVKVIGMDRDGSYLLVK